METQAEANLCVKGMVRLVQCNALKKYSREEALLKRDHECPGRFDILDSFLQRTHAHIVLTTEI